MTADQCKLYCQVDDGGQSSSSPNFYRLKNKVIDGTKCTKDGSEICVNGICMVNLPVRLLPLFWCFLRIYEYLYNNLGTTFGLVNFYRMVNQHPHRRWCPASWQGFFRAWFDWLCRILVYQLSARWGFRLRTGIIYAERCRPPWRSATVSHTHTLQCKHQL